MVMLEKTDLVRVSLSSEDKRVEQPSNLFSFLFNIGIKSSILGLVMHKGRPRYVCGRTLILQSRRMDNSFFLSLGVLIDIKVEFSLRPVQAAK